MEKKKYGALSSSVNPEQLSLMVISIVRVLAGLAVSFGLIEATGVDAVIEQVPALTAAGYAAWYAGDALVGAARKAIAAYYAAKQ
jgi:hypothetical protein